MQNRTLTYNVVLELDNELGGYTATCPTLPAVVTEGETIEKALEMAKEAVAVYLGYLSDNGLPIPQESDPLTCSVTVDLNTPSN